MKDFAFVDFQKESESTPTAWGEVLCVYMVATLLANCKACLYGNQISMSFNMNPPTFDHNKLMT